MTEERERFPDASDFSPGIIKVDIDGEQCTALQRLLRIIVEGGGDREATIAAIRDAFFAGRSVDQQLKSAANPLIVLNENNYGLIDSQTLQLTDTGRAILDAADEREAVRLLGRHIVRHLPGGDLLRSVHSIQMRGERPTKATLARELNLLGFSLTETHTDHTRMAAWLQEAGVLSPDYEIDDDRLVDVAGVSLSALEEWADLDEAQRAFLRALRQSAEVHGSNRVPVDTVRGMVEAKHGDTIWRRHDQIPADVIYPLAEAGWVERPEHAGRGARAGETRATERLLSVDIDVLDRQLLGGLPTEVRQRLRTPVEQLIEELDSDDKNVAGRALETLAARIAIDLGLTGLRLRERASHTGASEVDLIAEDVSRTYSRWVVQCKNTRGTAGVEVLTREVGVAVVTNANVVVLISRGGFSRDVRAMAAQVARRTNLQVVLIDGQTLNRYLQQGVRALVRVLERQARFTADTKRAAFEG